MQHSPSSRFVKQEQWKHWRAKRKLVLGPSTGDTSARVWGYHLQTNVEIYAKSCNIVHFVQKMVRNAVHNAFLNTLTAGTSFHSFNAFPLGTNPASSYCASMIDCLTH